MRKLACPNDYAKSGYMWQIAVLTEALFWLQTLFCYWDILSQSIVCGQEFTWFLSLLKEILFLSALIPVENIKGEADVKKFPVFCATKLKDGNIKFGFWETD